MAHSGLKCVLDPDVFWIQGYSLLCFFGLYPPIPYLQVTNRKLYKN